MEAWLAFVIMTAFTVLTGVVVWVGSALKKGEE